MEHSMSEGNDILSLERVCQTNIIPMFWITYTYTDPYFRASRTTIRRTYKEEAGENPGKSAPLCESNLFLYFS